jgi:predicted unusual protein kinase regulating ubiquinone biosynthesis (AarF/ABC1/UbiB family)
VNSQVSDLAPLRDRVTPLPFDVFKDLIPECITDVDPVPLASASVAQVHRAKILGTTDVVIKFKRPKIAEEIKEDIKLIKQGANLLKLIPNFGLEFMDPWISEFEKGILAEINFMGEVKNLSLFREIYRDRDDVLVPKPYSKLSNEDLIIMQYLPSKKIIKPFSSEKLINMFLEQMLYEGAIHGDLHSGNIGSLGSSIVLYDFGNVIRISESYRKGIRDLVFAIQAVNVDDVIKAIGAMGMKVNNKNDTKIFIEQYFTYLQTLDLKSFSIKSMSGSMTPVELDPTTLVILRSFTLLEGLCKELDPSFSYEDILQKNVELLFIDALNR